MILKMSLYRFRASLADGVERARRGDIIVLTRHGKPVAEVRATARVDEGWAGLNFLPARTRRRLRVRPFRGPGTLSREILQERRRRG
jgi:antitoxin (DNA-binding transcriptional repressor) of toxin-antitoxin stability system